MSTKLDTSALKPSAFTGFPCESIMQKSELETVACNIMKIRKRNGDNWGEMTLEEYRKGREETAAEKGGGYSHMEDHYFREVEPHTRMPEAAMKFSKAWLEAALSPDPFTHVTKEYHV